MARRAKRVDPATVVADVYDRLCRDTKNAARWNDAERAVWAIVTARVQRDFGELESIITDSRVTPGELASALELVGQRALARVWASAGARLERVGTLCRGRWAGVDLRRHRRLLATLEKKTGQRLWGLDARLAALPGL